MGCDIHMYKEKRVNGKWLTADEWESYDYGDDEKGRGVPWQKRFTARNYELFGLLAKGVRREHPFSFEPRGMPFNACEEVQRSSEGWDSDGHNHSYLYLHELRDMAEFLKNATIHINGMKEADELKVLRESVATGSPDWNLLFPYCAWGTSSSLEAFELDVPAFFYVGEGLAEIIASFDGIDGDNHRIVFWFDN